MNYGQLSKGCKSDNSLRLSLTNIQGIHSDFLECESFLESNSPDILALCETILDDSIDSGNFPVIGYLPLIQKDSVTHIHGLTSLSLCMVFDSISSNIDEVLSIDTSANVFVFRDFNIHHKDLLVYSGGTDRSGELYHK